MGLPTGATLSMFANMEENALIEKADFLSSNQGNIVRFQYLGEGITGSIIEFSDEDNKAHIQPANSDSTRWFEAAKIKHYSVVTEI